LWLSFLIRIYHLRATFENLWLANSFLGTGLETDKKFLLHHPGSSHSNIGSGAIFIRLKIQKFHRINLGREYSAAGTHGIFCESESPGEKEASKEEL
jgi:hypothetical protein